MPDTSLLSELAGSMKGNLAHEWDRVPNDNTRNVEEQVGQSDLEGAAVVESKAARREVKTPLDSNGDKSDDSK